MRPRPAPCFDLRPAIAEGSGLPSPEAPFGGADGALVLREAMQPGRRVGGVCGRSRFVGNSMKSSDFSSADLDHLTRIGSARRQQCAGHLCPKAFGSGLFSLRRSGSTGTGLRESPPEPKQPLGGAGRPLRP